MASEIGDNAEAMLRDFARFAGKRLVAALGLIVLGSLFEAIGLLWLAGFAGLMLDSRPGTGNGLSLLDPLLSVEGTHAQRVAIALAAFAVLVVARGLVMTARDRLLARLQFGYVEHIKLRLMRALAQTPYQTVGRVRHGRMVQALTVDLQQVGIATSFALQSIVAAMLLIGNGLLTILLAPIAAIAVAILIIGFAATRPLFGQAESIGRSLFRNHLRLTDGTLRLLGALKAATAQNLQHRFVGELEAASTAAMHDRIAFTDLQSGARILWGTLLAAAGGTCVVLGILVAQIEPEVMLTLLVALSRMGGPATTLHQGLHHVLHGGPAYESLRLLERELAHAPFAPVLAAVDEPARSSRLALEFRRVDFIHTGWDSGICGLTVDIAQGSFVGITGPSGAGKTTFVDLAAGILTPQSGMVYAFGNRLSGPVLDDHRDRLAYVGQNAFLFEDSLRRNFLLVRPGADDAQIRAVLELAEAADIVDRIEHGLDGTAGPGGEMVSAGERQRLALAGALLRQPRLLILDEATNALDLETERAILMRLTALARPPTILMIAHRAESLVHCDRILTIRDGRIVDDVVRGPGGRELQGAEGG